MSYSGFRLLDTSRGAELEFVMPAELNGKFLARLYCRGPLGDDANGNPAREWETLAPEYDLRPLVAPRQVHGANIIAASEDEALPVRSNADGVFISEESAVLASLSYADCAPIVIACNDGRPWMAILHSGFKGTMQNIAAAALSRFAFGRQIWAWIGPRICSRCYSRRWDDPAAQAALAAFSPASVHKMDGKIFFDIGSEIRRQLIEGGVPAENIFDYKGCTQCEKKLFYSYRAGDEEKRNFLLAGCATNRQNM